MKKKIIIVVISLVLIAGCIINSLVINTKQLNVRQVTIENEKIDPSFNNFVIAYFSDTYLDKADSSLIDKVVKDINDYSPDVVIFGGDLANDYLAIDENQIIEKLSSINSQYGKYAVLGENDISQTITILENAGFKVLDNNSNQIYLNKNEFINIVGINNMINGDIDIDKAYEKVNSNHFTLAICHTPDIALSLPEDKTNYLLAGHSLGGEVYIPLINNFLREEGSENYYHGTYDNGSFVVDVTNGVGLKNKSARFLADAEVVIYKLKVSD